MKAADALELRPGETDKFYFVFADMLATGDAIASSPAAAVTSAGLTVSNVAINSTPLTLDGVEYAADTVVSFDATDITLNDTAECVCTVTTDAGRVLKSSIWLKGIAYYAD